jgi:outer membrane protein W
MKKIIVVLSVFLLTTSSTLLAQQKQGVKLEGSIGIVTVDYPIETVFGLGLDLTYLFDITSTLQLGPSVGYHNFFGQGSSLPPVMGGGTAKDIQVLPISASARYYFIDEFFIGTDLGYGLHLDKSLESESGFYFKPKVGLSWGPLSTILSYSSIIGEFETFSVVQLGFEVAF